MGNSTVGIGVDMSSGKLALDTCLYFLPIPLDLEILRQFSMHFVIANSPT
jgi:hypothetical protein